jgi:hypothetical protein
MSQNSEEIPTSAIPMPAQTPLLVLSTVEAATNTPTPASITDSSTLATSTTSAGNEQTQTHNQGNRVEQDEQEKPPIDNAESPPASEILQQNQQLQAQAQGRLSPIQIQEAMEEYLALRSRKIMTIRFFEILITDALGEAQEVPTPRNLAFVALVHLFMPNVDQLRLEIWRRAQAELDAGIAEWAAKWRLPNGAAGVNSEIGDAGIPDGLFHVERVQTDIPDEIFLTVTLEG